MCRRLFDDQIFQFGTGGDGSAVAANQGVNLSFDPQRDEIEIQVLNSTNDGDVQIYKSHAESQNPQLLVARVAALASENAAPPVSMKARSVKYSIRCSNASSGLVTVIVRQYRSEPCRS